jgi:F-type H+-transporting ATPase subunit b
VSINFFWVIVAALNFIVFLALMWRFAFDPIAAILAQRKARIDQGLADAEAAGQARQAALKEHEMILTRARREAAELVVHAQKAAEELREADIAATKEELDRLRAKAASDITAERDRALADLQARVADLALAAAGKVVSETMTDARQRRLVEEFLRERTTPGDGRTN